MADTYQYSQQKKNRRIAFVVAFILHLGLALLFWFTMAWRPPNPPIPVYGIEVNFGQAMDAGFGQEQPKPPAEEKAPPPVKPQPVVETPPPTQPVAEQTPPPVETPEETPPPEPTTDVVEETETIVEESQEEVPVAVKEKPVEQPKKEPIKPEETAEQKPATPPKEAVEQVPEPVEKPETAQPSPPAVDSSAMLSTNPSPADESQQSQGNVANTTGDQGSEEGSVNADALLESSGGSGGSSLDMPGWAWAERPKVVDSSNETGEVVIEIRVDADGRVISATTLKRTVTRPVANVYLEASRKLTFEPVGLSGRPPLITVGRITYIITQR